MAAVRYAREIIEPELDPVCLAGAIPVYFKDGHGVALARFLELSAAFYSGMDLDDRGDRWQSGDTAFLPVLFRRAVEFLPGSATGRQLLIVGSGPGRLIGDIVAAAVRCGFVEVVINDIVPEFVTAAQRALVASGWGRHVRIVEAPGDAAALRLAAKADLAMSWFFVSGEVCNVASAEALRMTRRDFYRAIAGNLVDGGCLIEDMPERDLPGFYATLVQRSRTILVRNGLVGEAADVLALSYVPRADDSLPHHVRCLPTYAWRRAELADAGFQRVDSWNDHARAFPNENPVPVNRRRIKRIEILRKAIDRTASNILATHPVRLPSAMAEQVFG